MGEDATPYSVRVKSVVWVLKSMCSGCLVTLSPLHSVFSALSASKVGSAEFRKENNLALGPISGIKIVEIGGRFEPQSLRHEATVDRANDWVDKIGQFVLLNANSSRPLAPL